MVATLAVSITYRVVESIHYIPETNIMCVNYTQIKN